MMSFSSLRAIEECPLRWALRNAKYAGIWANNGYPSTLTPAQAKGTILHRALELLVQTAAALQGAEAPLAQALREVGGLTAVLERCTEELLSRVAKNPRLSHRSQELKSALERQMPALRPQLQMLISRLPPLPGGRVTSGVAHGRTRRLRYVEGAYSEVMLKDDGLRWLGIADLVCVNDAGCQIVDFKTGDPKPEHLMQVQVYALLWARDRKANPLGRPVTRLLLRYATGDVEVAVPDPAKLNALASELGARSKAASAAIAVHPPRATPSAEACASCEVRHLCPTIWEEEVPVPGGIGDTQDLQIELLARQGEWSWLASVQFARALPAHSEVLLRVRPGDHATAKLLQQSRTARLLGVRILPADDASPMPIVALTSGSEVFVLRSAPFRAYDRPV